MSGSRSRGRKRARRQNLASTIGIEVLTRSFDAAGGVVLQCALPSHFPELTDTLVVGCRAWDVDAFRPRRAWKPAAIWNAAASALGVVVGVWLTDGNRCLPYRSEEHTSELQSLRHLVCRLLLEKT